jgi:protein-tyrosine phosphatase
VFDIHCHLLPGIDDGPATVEASLALARALVDDGMSHVVCTPHVFPGRFENRRSSIQEEFARFDRLLEEEGIPLSLGWAGEVRLTPEILELLPLNEVPFLGRSDGFKNMLLEMPDGQIPLGADRLTHRLLSLGIRPVIVHPERNRGVMERIDRLRDFVEDGCLVQLTAGSLVGQFGTKAQLTAHQLIDKNWVHVVASDAHNLTGRRPRMTDAEAYLVKHWGVGAARQLTLLSPAALCEIDVSGARTTS